MYPQIPKKATILVGGGECFTESKQKSLPIWQASPGVRSSWFVEVKFPKKMGLIFGGFPDSRIHS